MIDIVMPHFLKPLSSNKPLQITPALFKEFAEDLNLLIPTLKNAPNLVGAVTMELYKNGSDFAMAAQSSDKNQTHTILVSMDFLQDVLDIASLKKIPLPQTVAAAAELALPVYAHELKHLELTEMRTQAGISYKLGSLDDETIAFATSNIVYQECNIRFADLYKDCFLSQHRDCVTQIRTIQILGLKGLIDAIRRSYPTSLLFTDVTRQEFLHALEGTKRDASAELSSVERLKNALAKEKNITRRGQIEGILEGKPDEAYLKYMRDQAALEIKRLTPEQFAKLKQFYQTQLVELKELLAAHF